MPEIGIITGEIVQRLGRARIDSPARRVSHARVNVFQRHGKVDNVQVKVVDAPVGQLLLADGFNALLVMEGVPQLRHDEELLALHKAIFDGSCDTLAALDFVAVV